MSDEGRRSGKERRPANDNRNGDGTNPEALRNVNDAALQLARIIGRRMAREDFARRIAAANDNSPLNSGAPEQGADKE